MKKFLAVLCLLAGLGGVSRADRVYPDRVYQVAISSFSVQTVTVSTSVVTQMDTPTQANRVSVEIQNIDAAASLWCTHLNTVTVNNGRKITAGNSWIVDLLDKSVFNGIAFHVFCISDGAASTKAAVTQMN